METGIRGQSQKKTAETTYLHDTLFNLYSAGVYSGTIRFTADQVMHAKVEPRRRTQMQEDRLSEHASFAIPLQQIHESLHTYADASWSGHQVELADGARYEAHVCYTAVMDGERRTSQVWAFRNGTALDVVTVDGRIIAFLVPSRYGMELMVKAGFESLTPLVVYDDERLSKPLYGVNDLGTFLVPMRDGVRLATDVYLPEGVPIGCKLPTILVRTCYDRNRNKSAFMHWVNKGYAVVNQDVRGRADSEGELVPFYYERDDGSDTIDWIVAQDWSDGQIGMWGASYLGFVVMAAASSGHPNLKAVVDEVNVGSPFVDTVRRGGTVCSWPLLSWTLAQSVGTRTDFDIFGGITVNPEEAVQARPIREIPQQMIGRRSGPWDIWSEHPEYDDFWRNCTFSERGAAVTAPVFVISGWYDGDSAGVSETWRLLSEHDVPNRKIWLGPWEHGPNRARDLGDVHFSNDAVVYNYDVNVLRWFDRFLKGISNGIDAEPRATYYVVGENRWRTSEDWTPVESTVTPFYLASGGRANSSLGDGRLVWTAPDRDSAFTDATEMDEVDAGRDSFLYNPDDPVSDQGDREPENMRTVELRNDVLVYSSAPLTAALTVAGELSAEIYAASTGVDTDWAVALSDVDEAGNSIRLSNYIVRAKYRHGFDQPEWLVPGQVEKFTIFMPNIGHTFPVGHRIRFTITSSNKMVSFPHTNTGQNPYDDVQPVTVQQSIVHTAACPSHINLPILAESSS